MSRSTHSAGCHRVVHAQEAIAGNARAPNKIIVTEHTVKLFLLAGTWLAK
jgi:hypothetical protein